MRKNGFTLVELLAVIVILAIIVLIAAPIVSNIINESEESAAISSAELYLDAVENSMLYEKLENGIKIEDGIYKIMTNGNICLGTLSSGVCSGDELEVGASGALPSEGIIKLENGNMINVSLKYDDIILKQDSNGQFVFSDDQYLKYYNLFEEIVFNPGDGNRNWYVIEETEDSFTLMLSENLLNPNDTNGEVYWYRTDVADDSENNNYGPITAITTLNSLTSGWTNVDPIVSYTYINNENGKETVGYQKLDINNGVTIITSQGGTATTVSGTTKARLMSVEELFNLASKKNSNFKEENIRTFATNNFSTLKQFLIDEAELPLGDDVDTISELLTEVRKYFVGFGSDHFALYFLVSIAVMSGYASYDLALPEFLYSNLDDNGYWTISTTSMGTTSEFATALFYEDYALFVPNDVYSRYGIRPIITINK